MPDNIELHLLRLHYYNNMKEISSYIIEKLHLDKNIQVSNRTFIGIFGLSDDKKGVSFKEFNTEEKLRKYVIKRKNVGSIKKRDLLCYDCPTVMKIDLLDMCFKSYNDEFGWAALDDWCQKNDIRYIFRNDVLTENLDINSHIDSLITEKLHLNKDIKIYSFDEDEFQKIMKRYGLGDGDFTQNLREWFKEDEVNDIEIYGWANTNKLMEVETFLYDDVERKKLIDILLKDGEYKPAKMPDKSFYYTKELFGYISNKDKNLSLVARKIS